MKTEVKKLEKCQVSLTVTLEADEAKGCVKEVEKAFLREARLPGFRPGKAPIELIRKEFAAQLSEEVKRSVFRQYYAKAVEAEKVEEVALADVKEIACDATGGAFTAIIDVKP
jgi:trigger factor